MYAHTLCFLFQGQITGTKNQEQQKTSVTKVNDRQFITEIKSI